MKLDPEVQTFADLLRDIIMLLNQHGHASWADQIKRCLTAMERSDAHGLHQFLTFYGGMGSVDDVVLCEKGTPLATQNDRFRALLTEAWEIGHRLSREES